MKIGDRVKIIANSLGSQHKIGEFGVVVDIIFDYVGDDGKIKQIARVYREERYTPSNWSYIDELKKIDGELNKNIIIL